MHKPAHIIEVFLQPGDFYFGGRDTRIRTLLGSCVAITMWHPSLLIGGMCHYLLPTRNKRVSSVQNGRYADEAMEMFVREIRAAGTRPAEYQVKLFGGGNMFPGIGRDSDDCPNTFCNPFDATCRNVACRNEMAAQQLVKKFGFSIKASCLGGAASRQIFFDIWNGHAWSRLTPIPTQTNQPEVA